MVPQPGDEYLKFDGMDVLWPLSVPTEYGEWMLVTILYPQKPRLQPANEWVPHLVVVPVRALESPEVSLIKQRSLLWWGMKIPNQAWARLMCRTSLFHSVGDEVPRHVYDPTRAIGV